MCVNDTPAQLDRLLKMAGTPQSVREITYPADTWPIYRAPMLRTAQPLRFSRPALGQRTMASVRLSAQH